MMKMQTEVIFLKKKEKKKTREQIKNKQANKNS